MDSSLDINDIESQQNYIDNPDYLYYYIKNLEQLKDITTHFDQDGNITEIFFENNKKKHGLYESYYKNGRISKRCSYLNDEIHGQVEEFYDNGRLKAKFNVYYGTFAPCLYIDFYENGQLMSKYLMTEGGKPIADYIFYYESGQIKEFKNTKEGKRVIYEENGKIKLYIDYNSLTGSWYYPNGLVEIKYKFKKELGEQNYDGYVEKYYESGKLQERGNYVQNRKNGDFEFYYDNFDNSKKETCKYCYDKKDGNVVEYEEDGRVKNEYTIDNRRWYFLYFW